MGLSATITGEINRGVLLIFQIIKWAVILAVSGAIAGAIIWLLNKLGIITWLFKKKIKKKKKKK